MEEFIDSPERWVTYPNGIQRLGKVTGVDDLTTPENRKKEAAARATLENARRDAVRED